MSRWATMTPEQRNRHLALSRDYKRRKGARPKGSVTSEERFWKKVDKSGDCWLWTASTVLHGYGAFGVGKTTVRAHRFSYELAFGPIPPGLCVLHHCDTPACVNPDHLFVGTNADNTNDMVRKGRNIRGERVKTAKLTTADIVAIRTSTIDGHELARLFGIHYSNVCSIRAGRSWRHV